MTKEGWGWEFGMRKTHYFKNGISLCGRWGDGGDCGLLLVEKEGYSEYPLSCVVCKKKLKDEKEG